MQLEPTFLNRMLDARAKLWTGCLEGAEKRRVELSMRMRPSSMPAASSTSLRAATSGSA